MVRIWSVAKVAGPAFVAAAALVLSVLAYKDQHAADATAAAQQKAADVASYRHDAEQMSFIQQLPTGSPHSTVTVLNTSTGTMTNVILDVEALAVLTTGPFSQLRLNLGSVPPCSVATADLTRAARQALVKNTYPKKIQIPFRFITFLVDGIYFVDRHQVQWEYQLGGTLLRLGSTQVLGFDDYLPLKYRAAHGCS